MPFDDATLYDIISLLPCLMLPEHTFYDDVADAAMPRCHAAVIFRDSRCRRRHDAAVYLFSFCRVRYARCHTFRYYSR